MQQNLPFVVKKGVLVTIKYIFVNFYGHMRYTLIAALLLCSVGLSAQTSLVIEEKSYTNSEEYWTGVVIPRNVPTALIFRNNSIKSSNTGGYMLQAGDDVGSSTNNNLDGEIITGNKFVWEGTDMTCIAHGLFTGNNINALIKYNSLSQVPMGIIRKSSSNMSDTEGGIAYNIVKSGAVAINIKGISNIHIYNNTLYTDRTTSQTWRGLVYVYTNKDVTPNSVSHNTKIFNNIFYTKYQTYCIQIGDSDALAGFESDYNIFYCETGTPVFNYCGSKKTFTEWQALGYDTHSKVINPSFKDLVNFVPAARLDYGNDLGAAWAEGLSVNAEWGTTDPETEVQNGKWQVGAVIYKANVTPTPQAESPTYSGSVISEAAPDRIELTFSLELAAIVPAASAFTISVNGSPRSVNTISVSGTKALLTLASPVLYGDRVTVAYTKPATNPLQTNAGGQVPSFTALPVTNNRTPPAKTPPSINIASPTKNTSFIAPATVTIDASASDSDGTVVRVEFFNGTVKLGERTTAPWSFAWKDVREGTYSITAAAIDNSGSRAVSSPVTVVVEKAAPAINQAPSVVIVTPLNIDSFESPATITLTATASDPDGSVTRVEYYIGDIIIGESFTSPFPVSFQSDTAGIFQIKAIAYDNLNASTTSLPIIISLTFKRDYADLINLYPSPNNGTFTVDLNPLAGLSNDLRLTILTLDGKIVYSDLTGAEEASININISDSISGIYIIRIEDDNEILTAKRFIKY